MNEISIDSTEHFWWLGQLWTQSKREFPIDFHYLTCARLIHISEYHYRYFLVLLVLGNHL